MKNFSIIFLFSLVIPTLTYATAPPPLATFINEKDKVCFVGNGERRACVISTLSENWKRAQGPKLEECPVGYTKVSEPKNLWVWTKKETFNTLSEAHSCGATFSKGSPIWVYGISVFGGMVIGFFVLFWMYRKIKTTSAINTLE